MAKVMEDLHPKNLNRKKTGHNDHVAVEVHYTLGFPNINGTPAYLKRSDKLIKYSYCGYLPGSLLHFVQHGRLDKIRQEC